MPEQGVIIRDKEISVITIQAINKSGCIHVPPYFPLVILITEFRSLKLPSLSKTLTNSLVFLFSIN